MLPLGLLGWSGPSHPGPRTAQNSWARPGSGRQAQFANPSLNVVECLDTRGRVPTGVGKFRGHGATFFEGPRDGYRGLRGMPIFSECQV